jgi:hypothetical protein
MKRYFVAKTPNGKFVGTYTIQEIAAQRTREIQDGYVATESTGPSYVQLVKMGDASWVTIPQLLADPSLAATKTTAPQETTSSAPVKSGNSWPIFGGIVAVLLVIVAGIFLFSNFGAQKESEAQNTLTQYIDSQSQGQIKLTSFKKTDGQKSEVMGVECYSLSYEADITFASDGFWLAHVYGQSLTFNFSKTGVAFGGMNGQTQVHSGDHVKIGGVMQGQKSEKGWTFSVGECHQM